MSNLGVSKEAIDKCKKKKKDQKERPSFEELYDVKETIGKGVFGVVKKVQRKSDNQLLAAKVINRHLLKDEKVVRHEVEVLTKLRHKNIVSLRDFHDGDKKFIYVVTELVTGGELFDRILDKGSYSELDAVVIIRQVLEGCEYLHSQGVIHRDIKPENLLFKTKAEDSKLMITDFGLSKIRDQESISTKIPVRSGEYGHNQVFYHTSCGTPGYVSPEVLLKQDYNEKVDVWAIGVISYILLCGYPPFYSEDDQKLFLQIIKSKIEFEVPYWSEISLVAKDFILQLLNRNVSDRPNCQQALKHDWLTGKAWNIDIKMSVQQKLKKSVARNRWRRAYNASLVMQTLSKGFAHFEIEEHKQFSPYDLL